MGAVSCTPRACGPATLPPQLAGVSNNTDLPVQSAFPNHLFRFRFLRAILPK